MTTESEQPASSVSVVIFTLNEERNLPRCLDSVEWCDDKIVVDSYSTDETTKICEARNIPFVQHTFEGFGSQRNWALEHLAFKHEWVLILDADERVPSTLATELNRLARSTPPEVGAYRLRRRFHLWGRWLRYSSLYPTWVIRFIHRDRVRYVNRGHGETQTVEGRVEKIEGFLIDENLNGLNAWFERQIRYARIDAEYELKIDGSSLSSALFPSHDPLQQRAAMKRLAAALPFRGFLYFIYSYFFRFGFLDGKDGFMFCRMKAMYQSMIEMNKYDLKEHSDSRGVNSGDSQP